MPRHVMEDPADFQMLADRAPPGRQGDDIVALVGVDGPDLLTDDPLVVQEKITPEVLQVEDVDHGARGPDGPLRAGAPSRGPRGAGAGPGGRGRGLEPERYVLPPS